MEIKGDRTLMDIISKISEELEVKNSQVQAAVDLLDEGCTVPFIARYRRRKQER